MNLSCDLEDLLIECHRLITVLQKWFRLSNEPDYNKNKHEKTHLKCKLLKIIEMICVQQKLPVKWNVMGKEYKLLMLLNFTYSL